MSQKKTEHIHMNKNSVSEKSIKGCRFKSDKNQHTFVKIHIYRVF